MNYKKALHLFGEYYLDRYSKEFPIIFSLCDFRNKSVLEIGSGREGYLLKEMLKYTERITATDMSKNILDELKMNVNVKTQVCKAERLPFKDKSYDIVVMRWVVSYVDLRKAIKEACRVAKENVLIVLPSEKGGETKVLAIKFKDKYKERKERISNIKTYLKENGFQPKEKRTILNFLFPDEFLATKIIASIGFNNVLSSGQLKQIGKFFESRKLKSGIKFTQGASFIIATRKAI